MTTRHPHTQTAISPWSRLRSIGAVACLVGVPLSALGWFFSPQEFYSAWLTAFFYWLGISLGSLGWITIQGMAGGRWGLLVRRIMGCSSRTLPLMIVLFLPIWLNAGQIYEWANAEHVQHHPVLLKKAGYLNVPGFQVRAVVYLALWSVTAWIFSRMPLRYESAKEAELASNWQRYSGMAFILYGFSMTLAAVDWMMSLEPEWFSTMYGLIHIAGQGVSGMAFAIVILNVLRKSEPWSHTINPDPMNDLGSLLQAAVMFWAYTSFFQYLVIWCGNLPEENVWYLHRNQNGWQYLILVLLAFDFILPFVLLLIRQRKRSLHDMARIASCLLVMRYFELYWLAVPGFPHGRSGLSFHWIDLAAFAAVGGAWIVSFCWRLNNHKFAPEKNKS